MSKKGYVYIMANSPNGTIYVGITSNLARRVYEHRESLIEGFTKDYGCKCLVWYEVHETTEAAIVREGQIKEWKRGWKKRLIEENNFSWKDLYPTLNS